jgi:hypothetical protein
MTEQRRNSFEDSDLRDITAEIRAKKAEKASIMAAARGECGGVQNQIKKLRTRATKELGIPAAILDAALKRLDLEDDMAAVDAAVPEDWQEVWADTKEQLCLFTEYADEDRPAPAPAKAPEPQPSPVEAAEQAEGEAVLNQVRH